jgi:radical SAM protein with 4Fe4S-binding SPASM domain
MSNSLETLHIYNLGQITKDNDKVLLYAPLSCNCITASSKEFERLEAVAKGCCVDSEYAEILDILAKHDDVPRISGVTDFVNLSILPTNACNFSCSYCYSAKGRSTRTIEFPVVENMIRWFVRMERGFTPSLFITIFGGGEPMLCWTKVVRPAIELTETLRMDYQSKINLNLITNGSILPSDFIEVCKRSKTNVSVSFEILEELQNLQRRNYITVYKNILSLCESGILPSINSVITDDSVEKMPKMVEETVRTLPGVKYLSFEPVTGRHTQSFYRKFTDSFLQARKLAEDAGLTLTTSVLRNVDVTVERYCAGELALTASGDLTACPCLSEQLQPGYRRWIYGHVSSDTIAIDNDKLTEILSHDVNDNTWCDKCFARYNCGGGCLNNVIERGYKQDPDYCWFFKDFLRKILIERMS